MENSTVSQLIQECKDEQNTFLDLGNCDLKKIPDEVFELSFLRKLNLGKRYYKDGEWVMSNNEGAVNKIKELPTQLTQLVELENLSIEDNPVVVGDILSQLPQLIYLNIGQTKIVDLDFLQSIPKLKGLNVNSLYLKTIERITSLGLGELTALDCSHNHLKRIDSLEAFPDLEYLNLSINQISKIEGLDHLKQLKTLYLGLNQIQQIENLGALANLEILSLGYLGGHQGISIPRNYNRGNLIPAIKNLQWIPKLKTLDLSGNLLKNLEGLEEQVHLEVLYVGYNQIEHISSIVQLEKLRVLSFGYTNKDYSLSKILRSDVFRSHHRPKANQISTIKELDHSYNLEYLSFDNNLLHAITGLDQNSKLKKLFLGSNQLTEIKNLESLSQLTTLDLSSNQLTEIKNLESLSQLTTLDLSSNQLTEIKNLESLSQLTTLNLDYNQLTEIKNLESLSRLTSLDLQSNQLTEIKNLESLSQLTTLDLSSNQLTEIKNLESLSQLTTLNLDYNQLTEIKNLESLSQLTTLNLDSNQLTEIKNLESLTQLTTLNLDSNQLTEIKNLESLSQLTSLDLDSNQLTEIKNLESLSQLTTLDLSSNQLTEIKNLESLSQLTSLDLDSNQLTEIKNLESLSQLTSLDLDSNQLTEIKNLESLSQLTTLDLSSNQLTEIKNLESLSQLTSLDLDSNQLTEIKNLESLSQLTTLDLSSNQLTEIKNLESLSQLTTLDLSSNQLTEIKNLESLSPLTSLDLRSNQLTEIKNLESLSQLTYLFLSSNQLTEIKNLESLSQLTTLNLSSNQLTEIKNLESLSQLTTLNLWSNQLTEIKNLESLSQLTSLDLSSNQLTEIKNLESLSQLTSLDLDSNQLTEIKDLESLSQLTYLNLSSNQLTEIKNLESLSQLTSLDLQSNQLTEIKNLESLSQLTYLFLSSNQLTEIKNLESLSQLTYLFLSSNQLTEIKNLESLSQLTYLLLSSNQIAKIENLEKLVQLQYIDLSKNLICHFNLNTIEGTRVNNLVLTNNEFANIPSEITNQENCINDVKAWFHDLETGSVESFEVKLMLVGNGRVGKTSLLKRLLSLDFDPKENSTHGIQLYEHEEYVSKLDQTLAIQAWDFGGQEVYHATHRLFMQSRALYLVVWDAETEQTPSSIENIDGLLVSFQHYNLPYWLEHARSLSWQSPIVLVQNKVDLHTRKLPENFNAIEERYDVRDYFRVSASTGERISSLKSTILEEFENMPEVGMKTPIYWIEIKATLLNFKGSKNTISYSDYEDLCDEKGLSPASKKALIRFLHNTGVVFFQNNLFGGQIILNQEWALKGLYALFERGPFYTMLKFARGRTNLEALALPWQKYDETTRKIFLSMMESCEICFKTTEDDKNPEYIITEFLPDDKDEKVSSYWEKASENELFLRYQTTFFHPAFISRFIAKAGRLAKNYDHIWRSGIWISYQNAHALIEAYQDLHQVVVRVKGDPRQRVLLLYLVHKSFKEIFYNPDSVKMEVSLADQDYFLYEKLKEVKEQGKKTVLANSEEMIDLKTVEFIAEILEASSEEEIKRRLPDIVPKPKQKSGSSTILSMDQVSENILIELKVKLKNELTKGMDECLIKTNEILTNGDCKNEILSLLSRISDLNKYMKSGQLDYDAFEKHNNKIRVAVLNTIDEISPNDLDISKLEAYLL